MENRVLKHTDSTKHLLEDYVFVALCVADSFLRTYWFDLWTLDFTSPFLTRSAVMLRVTASQMFLYFANENIKTRSLA